MRAGDTNPDNYYTSAPASNLAEDVKLFLNTTFRRCIPKKRWLEMAKEYPRPDTPATIVPRLDSEIKSALGRDQPNRKDENLSKVQASINTGFMCTISKLLVPPQRPGL